MSEDQELASRKEFTGKKLTSVNSVMTRSTTTIFLESIEKTSQYSSLVKLRNILRDYDYNEKKIESMIQPLLYNYSIKYMNMKILSEVIQFIYLGKELTIENIDTFINKLIKEFKSSKEEDDENDETDDIIKTKFIAEFIRYYNFLYSLYKR